MGFIGGGKAKTRRARRDFGRKQSKNRRGATKIGKSRRMEYRVLILTNIYFLPLLKAEERLAIIEEQRLMDEERQRMRKEQEKRVKEEQKVILGKNNSRPKLSFSLKPGAL